MTYWIVIAMIFVAVLAVAFATTRNIAADNRPIDADDGESTEEGTLTDDDA